MSAQRFGELMSKSLSITHPANDNDEAKYKHSSEVIFLSNWCVNVRTIFTVFGLQQLLREIWL